MKHLQISHRQFVLDRVRVMSMRRNLIDAIPEVYTVWQSGLMLNELRKVLGEKFGMVRALFFDKPPEGTWNLPWHKDTSIAVQDNQASSSAFSRPTIKAGVPHVIACDEVLFQMLTLRIHLDEVTDENGPLRVIPGSHLSSQSDGVGVDKAVTIHASPGDVLVMRPLISHASGPSVEGTLRHRRILHLEFAATRYCRTDIDGMSLYPRLEIIQEKSGELEWNS